MIDHIGIRVSDYERSKRFYTLALAPLGYSLMMEGSSGAGFRSQAIPDFWVKAGVPAPSVHVAFSSRDRAGVDAFYRAALAAGATDNGAPGLRPQYHAAYYGAFVLDPDGYNIEAVCHLPESSG
jgi:catechol 2,3-dioxygenase-like lactoylglutathione lyase family enzyme